MRNRIPGSAIAIAAAIALTSCVSAKFIGKAESAVAKDVGAKAQSIFISLQPVEMNEDDRGAFRGMLEQLARGCAAKGVASSVFVEEGIDLNGDALQKALAASDATHVLSIKIAEAWRRSDSPWLAKAKLEAVLEDRASGRKLWKSSVEFTHEWSGWGSFGEKGAGEIAEYYLKEFTQAGFI